MGGMFVLRVASQCCSSAALTGFSGFVNAAVGRRWLVFRVLLMMQLGGVDWFWGVLLMLLLGGVDWFFEFCLCCSLAALTGFSGFVRAAVWRRWRFFRVLSLHDGGSPHFSSQSAGEDVAWLTTLGYTSPQRVGPNSPCRNRLYSLP